MLNDFTVKNGYMTSEFNPEVFSYEIELEEDEDTLDFTYNATGKVSIYGNDNLTYGDNHIIIEVYDEKVVTYTFLVHKEKIKEASAIPMEIQSPSIKDNIINDIKTPGIAVLTFLIIAILYCIIFRKK